MLKQHNSLGKNNWASAIKNLLHSYGFGFVWLNQTVGEIRILYIILNKDLLIVSYRTGGNKLMILHIVIHINSLKQC